MTLLPALPCPKCRQPLNAAPGDAITATSFSVCLRRCRKCGIGYSNAKVNPTEIYCNFLDNLPKQVHCDLDRVLAHSLNIKNRRSKRARIGFSTSEDAVTWAVFSFLVRDRPEALRLLGKRWLSREVDPTVLFWGVPVPENIVGSEIRERIISVSDRLGEIRDQRSEPDLVLDYGNYGLIVIEAKLQPKNDMTDRIDKFDRYVQYTNAFGNAAEAKETKLYQLARNWRLAWDLAEGRPLRMVNLAPEKLFTQNRSLDRFENSLVRSDKAVFLRETWNSILSKVISSLGGVPPWLHAWLTHPHRSLAGVA